MPFKTAIKQTAILLADFEIWPFSFLILISLLSEKFLPYTIIYGVIFWFIRWVAFGRPTFAMPTTLPLLLLALTIPVSIYATPLLDKSMPEALRLLTGILYFFGIVNWAKTPRRVNWLLYGSIILGFSLAAASLIIVNYLEKFSILEGVLAKLKSLSFASTVHPNVMAGTLILFMIGICAFLIFRWMAIRNLYRLGLILLTLFMSGILILTQSRGAMIGLATGLCLLIVLRFRRGWIPIAIVVVASVVIVSQIGPQRIWNSIASETGGAGSLASREETWMRAKLMLQDYPLTGIGMGTYTEVADTLYPFAHVAIFVSHAHNLYLQIGLDLGLPGLVFWLATWFVLIVMAWQLYRNPEPFPRFLGAAVLGSMAAMGVHGLLDAVTWDTRPAIIIWGIWGLTAAEWNIFKKTKMQGTRSIEV